jgi:hypothetical protein
MLVSIPQNVALLGNRLNTLKPVTLFFLGALLNYIIIEPKYLGHSNLELYPTELGKIGSLLYNN